MILTFFSRSTLAMILLAAFGTLLQAGEYQFSDCYARWDEKNLTVGNHDFERSWRLTGQGLSPISFKAKNREVEWLVADPKVINANQGSASMTIMATKAKRHIVGSEGLRVEMQITGTAPQNAVIWLFPGLAGALIETNAPSDTSRPNEIQKTTGIEKDSGAEAPTQKMADGGETLRFQARHLRVIETSLRDQSDHHGALVQQQEWLLWPNESPFDLRCCVLSVENALDGSGIAYVKLSPLPHARPDPTAIDFRIRPGMRAVTHFSNGYPVAAISYCGGPEGRTRALHQVQRAMRNYVPGRDGQLISNTWGDRSRDARLNEAFLLKEVAAGSDLGVDIIQIDDGWQKGRSANSAEARGKGVWNGYWAADPDFWTPDPQRFPNGLQPIVDAAKQKNMKFSLWFGPDSSNDAANWQRDADHLLDLHKKYGVCSYKIDSMKTLNALSLKRQRGMFDRILEGSDGGISFDLDITAEIRPGFFGLTDIGPVYLENRYTDWGTYWPHHTLRNLWQLSHSVDPLRMRIEMLNHLRNQEKYGDDPLAPARYRADTLFAITMMANPLAFCEVSHLSADAVAQMKPLIATWKNERSMMHAGTTIPIGNTPDGIEWTGFKSEATKATYLLLFRELHQSPTFSMPIPDGSRKKITVLGGRGKAEVSRNELTVTIPEKLDFLWIKME